MSWGKPRGMDRRDKSYRAAVLFNICIYVTETYISLTYMNLMDAAR